MPDHPRNRFAEANAFIQHAGTWRHLGSEALARAFAAVEGVDGLTARAAVADARSDFTCFPLPHGLRTPSEATDQQRHTLALFALTAESRTPGCPTTAGARTGAGAGGQPAGGPCPRAAPAAMDAVDAVGRSVPTACATAGVRRGAYQRDLKVVVLGAEGVGKTTLVRSASGTAAADGTRSTPPGGEEPPAGWAATRAMDVGLVTLDDGTLIRLCDTPGAQQFEGVRRAILSGADFVILLLDVDSAKPVIPLLDHLDEDMPVVVAVRQPAKGPLPDACSVRSRLGLDDPTALVVAVDPRDPHSVRRMLTHAIAGLRRKVVRLTVLRLVASGLSDREIATALGEPSAGAVRAHVDAICRITGATSRVRAVIRGVDLGLVTAEDLPHAPSRLPALAEGDRALLELVILGVTAPADIAVRLGRPHTAVGADLKRLMDRFHAVGGIQLAAHAALLDAANSATTDELPDGAVADPPTGGPHKGGGFR